MRTCDNHLEVHPSSQQIEPRTGSMEHLQPARVQTLYSQDSQPACVHALYSQHSQPACVHALYSQHSQPACVHALYSQHSQLTCVHTLYSQHSQPTCVHTLYSQHSSMRSTCCIGIPRGTHSVLSSTSGIVGGSQGPGSFVWGHKPLTAPSAPLSRCPCGSPDAQPHPLHLCICTVESVG